MLVRVHGDVLFRVREVVRRHIGMKRLERRDALFVHLLVQPSEVAVCPSL